MPQIPSWRSRVLAAAERQPYFVKHQPQHQDKRQKSTSTRQEGQGVAQDPIPISPRSPKGATGAPTLVSPVAAAARITMPVNNARLELLRRTGPPTRQRPHDHVAQLAEAQSPMEDMRHQLLGRTGLFTHEQPHGHVAPPVEQLVDAQSPMQDVRYPLFGQTGSFTHRQLRGHVALQVEQQPDGNSPVVDALLQLLRRTGPTQQQQHHKILPLQPELLLQNPYTRQAPRPLTARGSRRQPEPRSLRTQECLDQHHEVSFSEHENIQISPRPLQGEPNESSEVGWSMYEDPIEQGSSRATDPQSSGSQPFKMVDRAFAENRVRSRKKNLGGLRGKNDHNNTNNVPNEKSVLRGQQQEDGHKDRHKDGYDEDHIQDGFGLEVNEGTWKQYRGRSQNVFRRASPATSSPERDVYQVWQAQLESQVYESLLEIEQEDLERRMQEYDLHCGELESASEQLRVLDAEEEEERQARARQVLRKRKRPEDEDKTAFTKVARPRNEPQQPRNDPMASTSSNHHQSPQAPFEMVDRAFAENRVRSRKKNLGGLRGNNDRNNSSNNVPNEKSVPRGQQQEDGHKDTHKDGYDGNHIQDDFGLEVNEGTWTQHRGRSQNVVRRAHTATSSPVCFMDQVSQVPFELQLCERLLEIEQEDLERRMQEYDLHCGELESAREQLRVLDAEEEERQARAPQVLRKRKRPEDDDETAFTKVARPRNEPQQPRIHPMASTSSSHHRSRQAQATSRPGRQRALERTNLQQQQGSRDFMDAPVHPQHHGQLQEHVDTQVHVGASTP